MSNDTQRSRARVDGRPSLLVGLRGGRVRRPHDRRPDHVHARRAVPRVPGDARVDGRKRPPARLPLVVYVLALGTFLMGTTEFVVAGLLPEIASDVNVSVAQAGLMITVFALGMIVGAP